MEEVVNDDDAAGQNIVPDFLQGVLKSQLTGDESTGELFNMKANKTYRCSLAFIKEIKRKTGAKPCGCFDRFPTFLAFLLSGSLVAVISLDLLP